MVLDEYGRVRIVAGVPCPHYEVSVPRFSAKEGALKSFLVRALSGGAIVNESMLREAGLSSDWGSRLGSEVLKGISLPESLNHFLEAEEYARIKSGLAGLLKSTVKGAIDFSALAEAVVDEALGFGVLAPLMADDELEEIMVNAPDKPVFVVHRRHGMCESNVVVPGALYLRGLIKRAAWSAGKDAEGPFLDAHLPDGSRVNATVSGVTPLGDTLTIRKFSKHSLSVVDLVRLGTLSTEAASFLWVMVEGLRLVPSNLIVTGGSGSGKTVMLNVLADFVPFSDRIISIEDTLELNLGSRQNWVQMESRLASRQQAEVSMDGLLKNALRMRPDRIVVGEVRGEETQTLFVAMDTGHRGCMGTLHSNTAKEMLWRLVSPPMSVPQVMVPLLDLVVVQYRVQLPGVGVVRRVKEIAEVSSMEGKPLLANVFEWDPANDRLVRTSVPSHLVDRLAERTGRSKKDILQEISVRTKLLEWMGSNRFSAEQVREFIQQYYADPFPVLSRVLGRNEGPA
ncbi:MAG: CpaF family protein [Candidatus Diapherotrites archaeon]|nr:CpaF family protein [Candidatus Diapherotrites archaeon]